MSWLASGCPRTSSYGALWSVYVIRNREGESRAYKKLSNISYFLLQSNKDCNILAVNALISLFYVLPVMIINF
jgi:hypothetical protein